MLTSINRIKVFLIIGSIDLGDQLNQDLLKVFESKPLATEPKIYQGIYLCIYTKYNKIIIIIINLCIRGEEYVHKLYEQWQGPEGESGGPQGDSVAAGWVASAGGRHLEGGAGVQVVEHVHEGCQRGTAHMAIEWSLHNW